MKTRTMDTADSGQRRRTATAHPKAAPASDAYKRLGIESPSHTLQLDLHPQGHPDEMVQPHQIQPTNTI